jgi:hypothetical protein
MHEIGRIDGGREFQTGGNVFRISENKNYDRKSEIPMKILEFKRSGIRIIVEFCGIPTRFANQAVHLTLIYYPQIEGKFTVAYGGVIVYQVN